VNEAIFTHVEAHVSDAIAVLGKCQDVPGQQGIALRTDRDPRKRLAGTGARNAHAVATVGVVDQARTVETTRAIAGAAPHVRLAHLLYCSRHDVAYQPRLVLRDTGGAKLLGGATRHVEPGVRRGAGAARATNRHPAERCAEFDAVATVDGEGAPPRLDGRAQAAERKHRHPEASRRAREESILVPGTDASGDTGEDHRQRRRSLEEREVEFATVELP